MLQDVSGGSFIPLPIQPPMHQVSSHPPLLPPPRFSWITFCVCVGGFFNNLGDLMWVCVQNLCMWGLLIGFGRRERDLGALYTLDSVPLGIVSIEEVF